MTEGAGEGLTEAIEDAVAAFDAANLTWGQFYQHIWLQRGRAERELAQPVRDALGDVALCVPASADAAAAQAFLAALTEARGCVIAFVKSVAPPAVPGDVREIPSLLGEAIDCMRRQL